MRRIAQGRRAAIVGFARFLDHADVTPEALVEDWGSGLKAAAGQHVLAIQDTSEIHFRTTRSRRRGLGEVGKGNSRGLLLHAMMALDAQSTSLLGLVGGRVWTRKGRVQVAHRHRSVAAKESQRWLTTAQRAKEVLASAACVTVIADRESDIYAEWASLPGPGFHLLSRSMQNRRLVGGGSLYAASAAFAITDTAVLTLPARSAQQPAREARVRLCCGRVTVARPEGAARDLPPGVELTLIDIVEIDPPPGIEPVHWHLLTTHRVGDAAGAWQIVGWYKQRWVIEQLFRVLKSQGLKLEDSQLETAERLVRLTAIATKAACVIMQLVQARDGKLVEPASLAFDDAEQKTLEALNRELQGKTALQKNPHPPNTLAWAAWVIAKLGGWDGYPRSSPPGPITFRHGLEYFHAVHRGHRLSDV